MFDAGDDAPVFSPVDMSQHRDGTRLSSASQNVFTPKSETRVQLLDDSFGFGPGQDDGAKSDSKEALSQNDKILSSLEPQMEGICQIDDEGFHAIQFTEISLGAKRRELVQKYNFPDRVAIEYSGSAALQRPTRERHMKNYNKKVKAYLLEKGSNVALLEDIYPGANLQNK